MKEFKASDLNRASGAILEEAMTAPISISRNGRKKFVIVPTSLYRDITKDIENFEKPD